MLTSTGPEDWQGAIDNIPDNNFIKNPAQRKNSLKEKYGEAPFNKLIHDRDSTTA